MSLQKTILLTFDVEEFDLPLEYKLPISAEKQMAIGKAGLDIIEKIIYQSQIATTLFTTANFADNYAASIKQLSFTNEIASHTYYHSSFKKEDLLLSKERLEKITGKKVTGLRMPRFKKIPTGWVEEAGYLYDSSINPTYIPGRYNNFNKSRIVYKEDGIMVLPVSVSTPFRFPLFWMAFKNIPYIFYKKMLLNALKKDGYISLYFHPWEFTDINEYAVPAYIKKYCKNKLADDLQMLINDLKNEGDFKTVSDFLSTYKMK